MSFDWLTENRSGMAIVRVSTGRQERNNSHDLQDDEIREYCSRVGIRLTRIVRIAESAKDSDDRKKYALAIGQALADDIRHVLFYMYDRETRNLTDNERNEKLVKAGLICLHYVRDGKVLHRESPDAEFFIRDVQAAANKQFVRNLSAKVNDSMRRKAESGWFPSNHVPWGYVTQRVKDEAGREIKGRSIVIPDPNTTKVRLVQREFELRAKGYSFEQIRRHVVEEGFIPAEDVKKYGPNTVERHIKNPFYDGQFLWQGVKYTGKHERIIPKSLYEEAQAPSRKLRLHSHSPEGGLLSGWIRCADCGCLITYDPKRKTYKFTGKTQIFPYYRCSNGKKFHQSLRGLYIPEPVIWSQLERAIDAISLTPEFATEIAEALNETHRQSLGESMKSLERARKSIEAIEGREARLYDDMTEGLIDREFFQRQREKLRKEKAMLRDQTESAQTAISGAYRETAASVIELCKNAKSLYLSRNQREKRNFLEKLISNLRLKGASVEFDLRKPFSTLAHLSHTEVWRAHIGVFRTECAELQREKLHEVPSTYR